MPSIWNRLEETEEGTKRRRENKWLITLSLFFLYMLLITTPNKQLYLFSYDADQKKQKRKIKESTTAWWLFSPCSSSTCCRLLSPNKHVYMTSLWSKPEEGEEEAISRENKWLMASFSCSSSVVGQFLPVLPLQAAHYYPLINRLHVNMFFIWCRPEETEEEARKRENKWLMISVSLLFLYMLLIAGGIVVIYQSIDDVVDASRRPVRSLHYKKMDKFRAPGE